MALNEVTQLNAVTQLSEATIMTVGGFFSTMMPDFVKAGINAIINAIVRCRLKSEYHGIVNKVLKDLGVLDDTYKDWTYALAVSGNTRIASDRLDSFVSISKYLKSASTYGKSKRMRLAIDNCRRILSDIHSIYCNYCQSYPNSNICYIEKFYSRMPHNPDYEKDLAKYKEIILLVADLTLELTRNLNYMLKEVRRVEKSYHNDIPTIYIFDADTNMTFVKDRIIPYTDLDTFIANRPTRKSEFYSHTLYPKSYIL